MALDNLRGDVESKAEACDATLFVGLDTVKTLKKMRLMLFADAHTFVFDPYDRFSGLILFC
jgi:hypothetical protein